MADRPAASSPGGPARRVPVVWGNVPQRNKNFTGRDELLLSLRQSVTDDVTAVLAHALHGMGGVGKTQLAIEYVYRYMNDYQLVWWISADQLALVKSSLAALAPRLELGEVAPGRVDDAVQGVLDALRRGEPYRQWLVVFDNADQPEEIKDLIPGGQFGHVIVTSRNHRWGGVSDVVEVDVFRRAESLAFLKKRVPSITEDESIRLAEELGDLPLALEQAGALQVESAMSVNEYLELLTKESSKILAENPPADYPVPVAAVWGLSMARLKEQMPFAWELLRRCAFFSPEPIRRDLLRHGRNVLGPPLRDDLADPILLSRATRELGRYALARVDNNRKTLQVHRLIQRLIRDEMTADEADQIQRDVHRLLETADPQDPDEIDNWQQYQELLSHVRPSEAVESDDAQVRRLIRNVVRYLYNIGDYQASDDLSQEALERWTTESGQDDVDVLVLAGQRADLLWTKGGYRDAYQLRRATLRRMERVLGEEHEATLTVTNGHGADLRARGEFLAALELDRRTLDTSRQVFRDHPRTFMVANNLALDQALNSDYEAALATDTGTYEEGLNFYGRDDDPRVIHSLSAIGRDLRQGGHYAEALATEEQAYTKYDDIVRRGILSPDHSWVLQQMKDLSVVRRKMGQLEGALELAKEVHYRFVVAFGERHPDTLAAAMNLGNAQRVYGEFTDDEQLKEEADTRITASFELYTEVYGADHPYTLGCALNMAIVRRRRGDVQGARRLLEETLTDLQNRLPDGHHYTLICETALATSLAETDELEKARDLGEHALKGLQYVLGRDHPHTLACANNLAIDLRDLGETEKADTLSADVIERYRRILPEDHFDVRDAKNGERIGLDFEPPPL